VVADEDADVAAGINKPIFLGRPIYLFLTCQYEMWRTTNFGPAQLHL
jgi:hypothetical protein